MINSPAQITCVEHPVIFKTENDDDLFGILTSPGATPALGITLIILPGGSFVPSTNRNRLSVRLARRLAAEGFHTFRFDYHGVGESEGSIDTYWLDRPFVEDLLGAVRYLERFGLRRLVLVGSCFGTRTILMAADRIESIEGAILISTPLRDYRMGDRGPSRYARDLSVSQLVRKGLQRRLLHELLAPRSREDALRLRQLYLRTAALKAEAIFRRVGMRGRLTAGTTSSREETNGNYMSHLFVAGFRELVRRNIPLLIVYGTEEDFYSEFLQAGEGPLRSLLEAALANIDIHTIEGVVHGFTTLQIQQAVLDVIYGWIVRRFRGEWKIEPGIGGMSQSGTTWKP